MTNDDTTINVSDPRLTIEIHITRGDMELYLCKDEDDTKYAVLDEDRMDTGYTWRGEADGIADFIALNDLFDNVRDDKEENA
jgi:hypothetical protein